MKVQNLPNSLKKRNLIKQKLFRLRFKKIEFFRIILKVILSTDFLEIQYKILAIFFIVNFSKLTVLSKHKNICLKTGYKKSVNIFTRMNRLTFKEEFKKTFLPGFHSATW